MIAPMPSATRFTGPSVFLRWCSPPSDSALIRSSDFVANRLMLFPFFARLIGKIAQSGGSRSETLCYVADPAQSRALPPQEVNGQPEQHDDEPRPGVVRLIEEQQDLDQSGRADVERRQRGVAKRLVRTLHLGTAPAQHE